MEPLSAEEVLYIAQLASLDLSAAEVEQMRSQLSDILAHFQSLSSIDTDGVEPTGHSTDSHTVLRDDEPADSLARDQVLANAPRTDGEFIRVRPVLD